MLESLNVESQSRLDLVNRLTAELSQYRRLASIIKTQNQQPHLFLFGLDLKGTTQWTIDMRGRTQLVKQGTPELEWIHHSIFDGTTLSKYHIPTCLLQNGKQPHRIEYSVAACHALLKRGTRNLQGVAVVVSLLSRRLTLNVALLLRAIEVRAPE